MWARCRGWDNCEILTKTSTKTTDFLKKCVVQVLGGPLVESVGDDEMFLHVCNNSLDENEKVRQSHFAGKIAHSQISKSKIVSNSVK